MQISIERRIFKNMKINKIIIILLICFCIAGCSSIEDKAESNKQEYEQIDDGKVTYIYCQSLKWLDEDSFAVGRLDGTLSIFDVEKDSTDYKIVQSLLTKDHQPISMIELALHDLVFVSNGPDSINLLSKVNGEYAFVGELEYEKSFGEFNSGCVVELENEDYFVSGHENGFIVIWKWDGEKYIENGSMDIKSKDPIQSEYMPKNIRGVAYWKDGIVITGGEDGDLVMIDVLKQSEVFRMRYRIDAHLGMNGIAIYDDYLITTNCTKGIESNINLYHLDKDDIVHLDSMYLSKDQERENVLANTVRFYDGKFAVSSRDYYIWFGEVKDDKLNINKIYGNGSHFTSAIFDLSFDHKKLALAIYEVELVDLGEN